MEKTVIQRHQSRLVQSVNNLNQAQEITVYSMVGTPLITSSNYIVPVKIPTKACLVRVTVGEEEFTGFLVEGTDADNITIKITNDDKLITMTFKKYDFIEYLGNPKAQIIKADPLYTDGTSSTVFSYITSDLHWDPVIYHFIKHHIVESIIMGKIVSKLPFDIEGATLIADSYPSYFPGGMKMRVMSSAMSSSTEEGTGIEGNWISYETPSIIEKDTTTIVALQYGQSTQGLNEPIPSKIQSRHVLTLNPGITRAEKEISFLSPFETPSGEHVFITQDGLTLQSNKEEYRKGQRLIQSLGQTAEVRANTNISVEKVPSGIGGNSIEVINIKASVDVDIKTSVSLQYFIGSRKYEIVGTTGINKLTISADNQFLTFTALMEKGSYKFNAVFRLF